MSLNEATAFYAEMCEKLLFTGRVGSRRRVGKGRSAATAHGVQLEGATATAGTSAAGADTDEAQSLNLRGVAGTKGHAELVKHLLVADVLGGERPVAGVGAAAALLLLGLALLLLGALLFLFLVVGGAKGEDAGEAGGGLF